jgi:predicted membrane protein
MKKFFITTLAALMAITAVQAQDYKVAKSTGKLVVNLSSVRIEGYSGTEIVFSSLSEDRQSDERAKGLQPINGAGMIDNTGLGINVSDKGTTIEVTQVSQKGGKVKIMVPKGVSVSYSFDKVMNNGKAYFKNIESEVEVSVQYNSVDLENVTGPLSVKTIYGSVEAKFKDNMKGPISIVSIYGHVDVAIPATTKANLKMSTSYGEIFAASELKIDLEKTPNANDMISYSNSNVKGKLNGGGMDFTLKSDYSKIYLRKAN